MPLFTKLHQTDPVQIRYLTKLELLAIICIHSFPLCQWSSALIGNGSTLTEFPTTIHLEPLNPNTGAKVWVTHIWKTDCHEDS